jgi:hypothetical protein
MQSKLVNLARVLFVLPGGYELRTGRFSLLDTAKALIDRYGFIKFPQTLEEWQSTDGAKFSHGRYQGTIISQLVLYGRGLAVDTEATTDESEQVVLDLIQWGGAKFGITLPTPRRGDLAFVSSITFVSDISLDWLHPALRVLGERATLGVNWLASSAKYETAGLTLKVDDFNMKFAPAAFSIERRVDVKFSDNTYFSTAPMRTSEHVRALEEFEVALRSSR